MKFNRILDVTECDSPLVQTYSERDTNQMLQYDESDLNMMLDNDDDYGDQNQMMDSLDYDLAIIHPESVELLDDWKCAEIKVDEIVSDPLENEQRRLDLSPVDSNASMESMDSFFKPEADQNGSSSNEQILSDDVVEAMRRNNRDILMLTQPDE